MKGAMIRGTIMSGRHISRILREVMCQRLGSSSQQAFSYPSRHFDSQLSCVGGRASLSHGEDKSIVEPGAYCDSPTRPGVF